MSQMVADKKFMLVSDLNDSILEDKDGDIVLFDSYGEAYGSMVDGNYGQYHVEPAVWDFDGAYPSENFYR